VRIKTIAVTYGRKFNLGDYNSLNIEVSAWADIAMTNVLKADGQIVEEQSEDVSKAYEALFLELRTQVKEYYLRAKGAKAAPTTEPYVPNIDPNE
jgi:hypothetical protein